MIERHQLCNCGANGEFTLSLEIETLQFDYEAGKRDCAVRMIAENSSTDCAVLASLQGGSSLYVLGEEIELPGTISVSAGGANTVYEAELAGRDIGSYYDGADYTGEVIYSITEATAGPIVYHSSTLLSSAASDFSVSLSCGNSITLGNNTNVISDITSQGYTLHVTVYDGDTVFLEKTLSETDMNFKTEKTWITAYPNDKSINASVKIDASLGSQAAAYTKTLPLLCKLSESDGRPTASVSTSVITNNPVLQQTGLILRNRSSIKVTVSSVSGRYGATIQSQVVTIDGTEYTGEAISPYFSAPGEHSWTVTLTDSRGFTNQYTGSFTVVDYGPPQFTADVKRINAAGEESLVGARFSVTAEPEVLYTLGGWLSYTYEYCWRISGGTFSSWTEFDPQAGAVVNAGLESMSMYEVGVRCSDSAGTSTVKIYPLDSDRVELHISKNRVAVGKRADTDNLFDCKWDIKSGGDIRFTGSDGAEISLRNFCESGGSDTGDSSGGMLPLRYKLVAAQSNDEISEFVSNIYDLVENCAFSLLVLSVKGNDLSLPSGLHLYFVQNDGTRTMYRKF